MKLLGLLACPVNPQLPPKTRSEMPLWSRGRSLAWQGGSARHGDNPVYIFALIQPNLPAPPALPSLPSILVLRDNDRYGEERAVPGRPSRQCQAER